MQRKHSIGTRSTGFLFAALIIVTMIGCGFAGLMFHYPSGFPPNNGDQMNVPGLAVGILMGAVSGLIIGGLQVLLLRLQFTQVRWWLGANAGAFALIHAIGDGLPDAATYAALQLSGAFLGLGLWLAVRELGANALYWIGGVAVSWAVGLAVGLAIANQSTARWALAHEIVGVCTGLAVGVTTAGLLWQLNGSRVQEAKPRSA